VAAATTVNNQKAGMRMLDTSILAVSIKLHRPGRQHQGADDGEKRKNLAGVNHADLLGVRRKRCGPMREVTATLLHHLAYLCPPGFKAGAI